MSKASTELAEIPQIYGCVIFWHGCW